MKKTLTIIFVALFASLALPFSAFAQNPDGGQGSGNPQEGTFQLVPCDNVRVPCDFNMLLVGFNRVLKFLLFLSIPLVMGMGLYTAFKFMTAGGDPGKLADAKKMFIPVALGLFWVLAAYIAVYTFLDKLVSEEISDEAKDAIEILNNRRQP